MFDFQYYYHRQVHRHLIMDGLYSTKSIKLNGSMGHNRLNLLMYFRLKESMIKKILTRMNFKDYLAF